MIDFLIEWGVVIVMCIVVIVWVLSPTYGERRFVNKGMFPPSEDRRNHKRRSGYSRRS